MDNETPTAGSTGPSLPRSKPFSASAEPAGASGDPQAEPARPAPSVIDRGHAGDRMPPTPNGSDRNGVFRHLVKDDADIAGLVAYSIYKQNKLDWLSAFEAAKGRAPEDSELASYIIGEGTPRRLATYRHLAEATLAGNGPDKGGSGGAPRSPFRRRAGLADGSALTAGLIATYALIALVFVIGFWITAHFTMASR